MKNEMQWALDLLELGCLISQLKSGEMIGCGNGRVYVYLGDDNDYTCYQLIIHHDSPAQISRCEDAEDIVLWEGAFASTEMWDKLKELDLLKPNTEEETDTCSSG